MTADNREYQNHNLAFFRELILGPALNYSHINFYPPDSGAHISNKQAPIVSSLGLIEATMWLRVGAKLGFFSTEIIPETVASIEGDLSRAWNTLLKNDAVSSEAWCDFMSHDDEARLIMDKFLHPLGPEDRFVSVEDPEQFEFLNQLFLGCLLLTSEMIFDPDVMMFLENVGWATDDAFRILLRNSRDLYLGFGSHIKYLTELTNHIAYSLEYFSRYQNPPHVTSSEFENLVYSLIMVVHERRMVLNRERPKIRCLKLGGEIAAMLYEPGPEWQEVRMSIFRQIAEAGLFVPDEESWRTFADTAESRLRETRPGFAGSAFAAE